MASHSKRTAATLARVTCLAIRAAILLASGTQTLTAQDLIADAIPTGVREAAALIEAPPVRSLTGRAEPKPRYRIVLAPNYVATARAFVYGAAIGFVSDSALRIWPLQLLTSAKRLDIGHAWQTSLGGELKVTLLPNQKLAQFSTKLAYQRTLEASQRQEYGVAAERKIVPGQNPLMLGASAAYVIVQPDQQSSTEGSRIASGLTWAVYTGTKLKADYVFKTGIATEDDFSFTLSQPFPRLRYSPIIQLVAAKHRVIALNVISTLYTRQ